MGDDDLDLCHVGHYREMITNVANGLIACDCAAARVRPRGGLTQRPIPIARASRIIVRIETTLGVGAGEARGGQMSQQGSDLPRFVQIIRRYRALVGIMALLGLLAGAVFAAVNPPVFTSRALVLMAAPSCPEGAVCGGPAFSPGYLGPRLLQSLPVGVRIKFLPGNYLWVTTTGGTPAQAEAAANAAAISYLSYAVSLSYPGWPAARILEPATSATGTAPQRQLLDDALLGAVFGLLLGVIAALAGGGSTIDTPAAPPGYDIGEQDRRAVQPGTLSGSLPDRPWPGPVRLAALPDFRLLGGGLARRPRP
jgi:hypothetical protein